jgi:radical SAM protein with 4Fe4S-binding SPASM domain
MDRSNLVDLKKLAETSSTFCLLPFIHMATKTDGDMKLCCRSWPVGNINNTSMEELWNSDKYKEVRRQLLNSERPEECHACWRHEDIGVRSMRQRYNKTRTKRYMPQVEKMADDYTMPFEIPILESKMSNFCNLKCRMCHPLDSTSWGKDWESIEHLMETANGSTYRKVREFGLTRKPYISGWENNEKFWAEFERLAPGFDRIEFAGGEPLIDPIHYRILNILKEHGSNIELKYSTNLTKLNYKKDNVLELWNHFKSVEVMISIDGVDDVYNYIRQLGDYQDVKENILQVVSHPKVNKIAGACTFQVYNIFSMPEIFDRFTEELNIDIHSHRVNYPTFLDMRIIPESIKQPLIENLIKYRDSIETKTHPNWTKERKDNAVKHAQDNINALSGGDLTKHIPEFIEFSDKLDQKQSVVKTWRDLLPELGMIG